ncbi:hypothetical protein H632_c1501p1 [Helicosporidium sp. ATCC 50920]|nr:hypothetical protein H632_c1501p1 [Helicosporidium sp. ATCC 50920]|eukprot:KDD74190.1 hypothetical protein H632_c1501p1 [Helicosporidium sp. ATCC 50920]
MSEDFRFGFYGLCVLFFGRVWLWHLSPAGSSFPGAKGFGWYFRFLTFWSLTLQLASFGLAALDSLREGRRARERALKAPQPTVDADPSQLATSGGLPAASDGTPLEVWADFAACAVFPLSNVVTALYYGIALTTSKRALMEKPELRRPAWLDVSIHLLTALAAWADLLLARRRSFQGSSRTAALGVGGAYVVWMAVLYAVTGRFPYPVLNLGNPAQSAASFWFAGSLLIILFFQLGRSARALLDGAPAPSPPKNGKEDKDA